MSVYKYTGARGTVYFIDYYANGKRYREKVGPKKKEAEEYLGKRLKEIRDGQIYLGSDRTKNGKPREIPVSDTLAKELRRIKEEHGAERITMLTNLVFSAPRERKRRLNGKLQIVEGPMRDIRVAWESAKKRAGIDPGFHFHDLRHTFASHQKMAGVDDYTLMAIMGHSDPKMMRRYAHLTPEHKRKAINSLPEWNSVRDGQKLVRNSDSVENVKRSVS